MTQRREHRTLQRACLLAAFAAGSGIAAATPPPLPEELLEYLGSWAGDDADWLVANAAAVPSAGLANAPSATPVAAKQPATSTTTTTAAPRTAPAAPVTGAERKP